MQLDPELMTHTPDSDTCSGCDVGRRAFLRDAAVAVAAFATVGAGRAGAMPITWIDAIARAG